jgi:hypothetical protein
MGKNRLNNFDNNFKEIAQKPTQISKKLDNTTQIKKDISAINKKTHNQVIAVPKKVDLFERITQKISLLALKPKLWLKSQTKMIDDTLKPQLISQIKKVIKAVVDKINNLKETKPNFKQNERTNTLSLVNEANNRNLHISYIQPLSQSSPKVQISPRKATHTNLITDTNGTLKSGHPLPKLMSLNVQPSPRLENVLNDLLERLYVESLPKIKNDLESCLISPCSINCSENSESPIPTDWSMSINSNEYTYEELASIKRKLNNFNAFNRLISSKNFNFQDYTLIASQFLDESIIRLYKETKIEYNKQ